ncbi:hypothetical protein DRJ17_04455 [Candidatus Woesearchaeota archaeon]|nr:MAG: hypothetical protein DRJ17_04455 [Candidatus Woesearchaeota archaeon]
MTEGALDIGQDIRENQEEISKKKGQTEKREEPVNEELEVKARKKSYLSLLYIIGALVVIFLIAFGTTQFIKPKQPYVVGSVIFEGNIVDVPEGYTYVYNGFKFTRFNNVWLTRININIENRTTDIYDFAIRFSPRELNGISIQPGTKERILNADFVYFTTDPDLSSKAVVAMIEIGRAIGDKFNIYNKPTKAALTKKTKGNNMTVITCEDADESTVVMYFKIGESTGARYEGNCILIEGETEWDIIRAADRLLYQMFGIME